MQPNVSKFVILLMTLWILVTMNRSDPFKRSPAELAEEAKAKARVSRNVLAHAAAPAARKAKAAPVATAAAVDRAPSWTFPPRLQLTSYRTFTPALEPVPAPKVDSYFKKGSTPAKPYAKARRRNRNKARTQRRTSHRRKTAGVQPHRFDRSPGCAAAGCSGGGAGGPGGHSPAARSGTAGFAADAAHAPGAAGGAMGH